MFESILDSKMQFFEENTAGGILNRFSKDVNGVDQLTFWLLMFFDYLMKSLCTVTVIMVTCPWLVVLAIASLFYYNKINE